MDDIFRSISDIRISQINMFGECKAMNLSQHSKLAELITVINFLKSQIIEIILENTKLIPSITEINFLKN